MTERHTSHDPTDPTWTKTPASGTPGGQKRAANSENDPAPQDRTPLVSMRGIVKRFGAIQALKGVDLDLYPGEVLGLVGDNSAGKSTLMKILTGAYQPDAGQIYFQGQPVAIHSPLDSRRLGIEMIYQDFAVCGNLDIATNIFLGRWPTIRGFVNRRQMEREATRVLERINVAFPSLRLPVESLSGGRQQTVAIARALAFNPRVLIMDEPTANLSPNATGRLLELVAELRRQGVSVIIISHRMQEIFEVGDRVAVLRQGEMVGTLSIAEATEDEILSLIIAGRRQAEGA